jgi:hypothetical protein
VVTTGLFLVVLSVSRPSADRLLAVSRIPQAHCRSQTLEPQPKPRRQLSSQPATHRSTRSKLSHFATAPTLFFVFICSTALSKLYTVETPLDSRPTPTAAPLHSIRLFGRRTEGRCRLLTTTCHSSSVAAAFSPQLCFHSAIKLWLHPQSLLLFTAPITARLWFLAPYHQYQHDTPTCTSLIHATFPTSILH